MSLKRKASFSALPNSPSVPAPSDWGMIVDGNTHLHSRTRKRFRDDRPCENIIHQNTLRWIYSAQKQQPTATTEMDAMDSEPTIEPHEVDPRQQTLDRFFKPPKQQLSFRPSREALAPRANETALAQDDIMRQQAFNKMNTIASTSTSVSNSPGYNQTSPDVDMNMDMDSGSGSDGSDQMPNNWAGDMSWM